MTECIVRMCLVIGKNAMETLDRSATEKKNLNLDLISYVKTVIFGIEESFGWWNKNQNQTFYIFWK